jgi:hypothetical protein
MHTYPVDVDDIAFADIESEVDDGWTPLRESESKAQTTLMAT